MEPAGRWTAVPVRLRSDRAQAAVRASVWTLLVLSCLSFIVQGANTPPRPHLTNHYLPGTAPFVHGPGGAGGTAP